MKRGLDWYRRDPIAFLGGIQGMPAREIAVYAVILDLLYQHGGEIHNDPSWIAGWIGDMGSASVRNVVSSLVGRGKVQLTPEGFLTNERVKNEVKTRRKRSENAEKTGHLGGVSSGKSRREARDNKDLAEANSSKKVPIEREEEKNIEGGGGMRVRAKPPDDQSFIVEVCTAAGVDKARSTSSHWFDPGVGTAVSRWRGLGLTDPEILDVIRAVAAARSSRDPPNTPTYFDKAMQRFAADKARPPLTPIDGGRDDRPPPGSGIGRHAGTAERRRQAAADRDAADRARAIASPGAAHES